MAIEGIIFDHDGTLVDSESIHFTIWQRLLDQFDVNFTEEEYLASCLGIPTLQCARHIVKTYKLDLSPETLYMQNHELTMKVLGGNPAPLMAGVEQCMNQCRDANMRIAVASGASRAEVFTSIMGHACLNHIHLISCRDDVPRNKPAPDVYLLALSKLALNSTQCIAIEDSQNGVKAALAAGLRCIAVPNKYSVQQDLSAADHIAKDLMEAWQIISNL